MAVNASDFEYPLEPELIAQQPLPSRDESRLMRLRRSDGCLTHHRFSNLPELLRAGDVLVLNDTRVIPAKFTARRESGGRIEALFCDEIKPGFWRVMLKGAGRCKAGETLLVEGQGPVRLKLLANLEAGRFEVSVSPAAGAVELLEMIGSAPLPPYIRRPGAMTDQQDRQRYQTVYASAPGAVAAPTAGLHFTGGLLERLRGAGVEIVFVTLHVGPGTFAPVKCEDLPDHKMHSEWYRLPATTAERLNAARAGRRRVVAVGSTSLRVLESAAARGEPLGETSGWTGLFLYPPAEFRIVDALITNFHLPRSTLLMLVAGFCRPGGTGGVKMILDAYAEARRLRYRFYSYGDAMLIE
ncbi:MAG TPA: tRNA preQ1(34) S-adenosylmethionine ribosyltransferase-isomerase QueA [Phycisphaerae bacterium]|nr:tRNA preQ1(34) S-adenosylmethionine ribosyltransferase-isomerase QueA [Phycisphaerae bacterium]